MSRKKSRNARYAVDNGDYHSLSQNGITSGIAIKRQLEPIRHRFIITGACAVFAHL